MKSKIFPLFLSFLMGRKLPQRQKCAQGARAAPSFTCTQRLPATKNEIFQLLFSVQRGSVLFPESRNRLQGFGFARQEKKYRSCVGKELKNQPVPAPMGRRVSLLIPAGLMIQIETKKKGKKAIYATTSPLLIHAHTNIHNG